MTNSSPPKPRNDVGVTYRVLQPLGHRLQKHVAAGVAQRVVDLLELVQVDEVNGAHIVDSPFVERLLHAVAQHRAVGQTGQSVEPRQMIDLGLGDLALGDVLDEDHHAAVLHRLHGEFERSPVRQVQSEGGIVRTGKPRIQIVDHALRARLRQQPCLHDALDQVAHAHAFQFEIRRQPHLLFQFVIGDDDAALGIEHAQAVRHVVDRRVKPLGEQGHVARGDDGVEQRSAQPVGNELDAVE